MMNMMDADPMMKMDPMHKVKKAIAKMAEGMDEDDMNLEDDDGGFDIFNAFGPGVSKEQKIKNGLKVGGGSLNAIGKILAGSAGYTNDEKTKKGLAIAGNVISSIGNIFGNMGR